MAMNILLKKAGKEERQEREDSINKLKSDIEKDKKNINLKIEKLRKLYTPSMLIKDNFSKVYKYCLTIFALWLIFPIICIINITRSPVWFILIIVYAILTLPIGLISLLIPTTKFFFFDLPKKIDEIKISVSPKYILAIFFTEYRIIIPKVVKINPDNMFDYDNGSYIVDKTASFISVGKIMLLFYIKGIPNPLKFNFTKYLKEYVEMKAKDDNAKVLDWEGKLVDVAFSSENLREYKKYKLFQEFFRDYQTEINKVVMGVIGFATLVCIFMLVMYFFKGG